MYIVKHKKKAAAGERNASSPVTGIISCVRLPSSAISGRRKGFAGVRLARSMLWWERLLNGFGIWSLMRRPYHRKRKCVNASLPRYPSDQSKALHDLERVMVDIQQSVNLLVTSINP
jgi:hypothetical protein